MCLRLFLYAGCTYSADRIVQTNLYLNWHILRNDDVDTAWSTSHLSVCITTCLSVKGSTDRSSERANMQQLYGGLMRWGVELAANNDHIVTRHKIQQTDPFAWLWLDPICVHTMFFKDTNSFQPQQTNWWYKVVWEMLRSEIWTAFCWVSLPYLNKYTMIQTVSSLPPL